jgi:hypothetical protein
MKTDEIKDILKMFRSFQRDVVIGAKLVIYFRAYPDESGFDCQFVRPNDAGEIEAPSGNGWVEIRDKKEKQYILASCVSRYARDLEAGASRKPTIDQRLLLQSWQLKGARKKSMAITNAPPFLQGGAPGLIQQK